MTSCIELEEEEDEQEDKQENPPKASEKTLTIL